MSFAQSALAQAVASMPASPPRRSKPAAFRPAASLFSLCAWGAASAQTPAVTDPALQQVPGAWRIAQARTEPMLDQRRARLDFHADGRLTGHTSCNPLNARYALEGDRLTITALQAGRERCAPLQLEQGDRVLSALEAVATARVRPDSLLELRDADGRGVLRATRWDAER
jgi:heat shock protein HslJ